MTERTRHSRHYSRHWSQFVTDLPSFETVEYATDPPYAHLLIVAGMLGAVLVLLFMAIVLAVG
jgi:hypothetical protein